MEIFIKHYGGSRINPSAIITLTFVDYDHQLTVDVTNNIGVVDVGLIDSLRNIADLLEEQNNRIDNLSSKLVNKLDK